MNRIGVVACAVLTSLVASEARAQYCPSHFDGPPKFVSDKRPPPRGAGACMGGGGGAPPPNQSGPGGSPPAASSEASSAECVGDPVTLFGYHAYTFDRVEDFLVRTGVGSVSFQRSFVSSDMPWRGGRADTLPMLLDIPKPFGASRIGGDTSQRWSHNFFSFVDAAHGEWRVRPPRGTENIFSKCSGSDCWAVPPSGSEGEQSRLHWANGAFRFFQDDGKQYEYAAATPDAGYYFLTSVFDEGGRLLALVNYAKPTSNCSGFLGIADSGLPYISTIDTNAGPTISIGYSHLGSECVVSSVSIGATAVATYDYQDNTPGHLSQATTLDFQEQYAGYQQGFAVTRSAVIVTHPLDGGVPQGGYATGLFDAGIENSLTVVSVEDPNAHWTLSALAESVDLPDGGSVCGGNACCSPTAARRADLTSAGKGDGSDAGAGYYSIFYYSKNNNETEGHMPTLRLDQCPSNPYSCSEGTEKWYWRGPTIGSACSDTNPAYLNATKDKRDNWTVTPHRLFDAGSGLIAFEQTAYLRGVPSSSGPIPDPGTNDVNALESTYFTHTYIDGGEYLATETRPSALGTDGGVVTTYTRNSLGQKTATFVSGATLLLDGGTEVRVVGTFTSYDAQGRVTQTAGPCIVANTSATDCSGTTNPKTVLSYYSTGNGNSSGQLHTVDRYTVGSSVLTTTYSDYTALGDPGTIVDESGMETRFTYSGHHVATRQVEAGATDPTWTYTWENEKLVAIANPEGNYDAYCYRTLSSPDGTCNGTWTGHLTRISKATSSNGVTGWVEAIVYDYWPDGTIKTETRYTNSSGPVARLRQSYAADAHRRPTFTGFGNGTLYAETKGFDPADNLAAVGPSFNAPPAFCRASGGSDGSSGALSRLCEQLGYDRANRLRQLDLFPDPTSNTPIRACLDYDMRGNVSRVSTGCSSSDTCSTDTSASTCGGAVGNSHDYLTDDFGNVVEIRLSGTDDGSGGRGVFRFEFDAAGRVVKQQTQSQRSASPARYVSFSYDRLGRKTLWEEHHGSTAYEVLRWSYDDDATSIANPPSACGANPSNTMGRLRAVEDALFTRYFQYDALGRVTLELRNLGDTGCNPHPDLTMAYSLNGNVTSIGYGFGRVVKYQYGDGGLADRVASISTNFALPDGGSQDKPLITDIAWEPFGGVRTYKFAHDAGVTVELEQGAAGSAPASRCPSGALGETVDQTGRVRSIRAWSNSREVYRRTYSWRADQIERIDSCYLGGGDGGADFISEVYAADAGSGFGYDGIGRLTGGAGTGPFAQRKYTYDSRGNVTAMVVDDGGTYSSTFDTGSANRRDWLTSFGTDSWNRIDLSYDKDGRVSSQASPADSSGQAATIQFDYVGGALTDAMPGSDTVMRAVAVSAGYATTLNYNYAFDYQNRRLAKIGPVSNEVYLYDMGHDLLESVDPDTGRVDDFVWLDGMPVASIRSSLGGVDATGTCDGIPCGFRFLIADHIGKPVLSLDSFGRITGVGEYEPYGAMNRVEVNLQSAHPATTAASLNVALQQRRLSGLSGQMRVYFPVLDTEEVPCGGEPVDYVELRALDDTANYEKLGGAQRGGVWSGWMPMTTVGTLMGVKLIWELDDSPACWPVSADESCSQACPPKEGSGWAYSGWVVREYEYQRFEADVTPYFPQLRFPGQFWDPETDLYENWNRFYSPKLARYLSPEPILQDPAYVRQMASEGAMLATYAYGRNNPLHYVDPTGRVPIAVPYSPNCAAICREAAKEQETKVPGSTCTATGWQKVMDVDVDNGTIKYTDLGCLCTGLRKRDWKIDLWLAYRPSIKASDLAK